MPSLLHEALLLLFRNRPTLAPELLRDALEVDLPPFSEACIADASLTQIVPPAYNADLVVLLLNNVPVYGIIVEAQISVKDEKRYTWPHYTMALRAKLQVPVCLLVVAPIASVAQWASQEIDIGQPCSPFRPLVLGPGAVPYVTDPDQAKRQPEAAVLSVLAHGQESEGIKVALAAMDAMVGLDDDRAKLYHDLILSALNESARRTLEELMTSGRYEYQSDFAKKYVADCHC